MAPFYTMTISAVAQYVGEFLQDKDERIKTDRFVISEIGQEYEGITSRPSNPPRTVLASTLFSLLFLLYKLLFICNFLSLLYIKYKIEGSLSNGDCLSCRP